MQNNTLPESKIQWLTYLVYILLAFLTLISGWSKYESGKSLEAIGKLREDIPREYVSKERYINDVVRRMDTIEAKLDRILEIALGSKNRILSKELGRE